MLNMLPENEVFKFQAPGRVGNKYLNTMSLTFHQLHVGVAFQPRIKIALNSSSFHRGWKAAPTQITPSLKQMTLPLIPAAGVVRCSVSRLPCGATFSERSLGKSLVPIYSIPIFCGYKIVRGDGGISADAFRLPIKSIAYPYPKYPKPAYSRS